MKAKVVQLPVTKSDLREHLEWLIENEKYIQDLLVGYTLVPFDEKGNPLEDEDYRDIYVFWLSKDFLSATLGIAQIIVRYLEDAIMGIFYHTES